VRPATPPERGPAGDGRREAGEYDAGQPFRQQSVREETGKFAGFLATGDQEQAAKLLNVSERSVRQGIAMQCPPIVYTDLNSLWILAEWHEVKKIQKGVCIKIRYLQINNFAISTLFRA
jgi:hypothetical protein